MFLQRIRNSILTISLIIFSACSINNNFEQFEEEPIESLKIETSLWLVDWAYEKSINEAKEALENIDNVLLFATYFDEAGHLYQTENMIQLIHEVVNNPSFNDKNVYLSIVNDQFKSNGTIIQKNPDLLKKLLANSSSRYAHIGEIISYVKEYPVDGIEIDYERIPSDLVDNFFLFAQELQNALEEINLSLRIILEPGFPVESSSLPAELQYVVMAYNLHGYHSSDPGPKADYAFLDRLAEKFPNQSENINVALATGGFSWKDGTVEQLTDEQIKELVQKYNPDQIRDNQSGALSFIFEQDGEQYEVWYADAKTIALWIERLVHNGMYRHFSIWRAGGLTKETLSILNH